MFRNNENEQYKPLQTIEITTQQETTQQPSIAIQNTTEPESIDDGSSDADDDYILPDSGTRKLTNSDLAGLDADELDEDSIRTTYKIILTINGGMWERLNPKISPRICSMMLKSIMLISFEIMRKNMLSSI